MTASLSLRRYVHDTQTQRYTNSWVADMQLASADIQCVPVRERGIYCIYPGKREQSFLPVVPFWIFCGRQHVGQARAHDVYPYFEVSSDGPQTVFVVLAPDLEQAKSKLLSPC